MSSNVFFAGNVIGFGDPVVSIYNNPTGFVGNTAPLLQPNVFLDRIRFDTRFSYLNIISKTTFTQSYPFISPFSSESNEKGKDPGDYPRRGDNIYRIKNHGIITGVYPDPPIGILIDADTREVIGSNMIIQNISNNAFRYIGLLTDVTGFYIKESYFVRNEPLTSITRRYTLFTFNSPV